MAKGKSANITGNQLEKAVQTVLLDKGFEIEMYSKWEKILKIMAKNCS